MPDPILPAASRRAVLIATILASSLGFIDVSVVPVAMPAIRTDLGADFAQVQWIANSYTLLLSALILVGGAAGDRFGQRETFAAGIAVFCLASLACAVSKTAGQLITWRAVQGAGAAFMVPGSLALIAHSFRENERGRAIGLWSMTSGLASAIGPMLGGFLIDRGGAPAWRWIFWINLPVGLATLVLLYTRTSRIARVNGGGLDLPGALLVTLGLGGLALGLTEAGETSPHPGRILLALGAGCGALAAFWIWEGVAATPMLPRALFRLPVFNGANLLTFFLYFALAGTLFFLPMTLIEALGLPEAYAGSVFMPFTLTMAVMSHQAGRLSDKVGPRLPIAVGSAITGLSFLGLGLATMLQAYAFGVLPAMAVMGIGMGLVVTPLSTTVMSIADDALAGTASGVNNGVARMAGLFAVAGLGLVAAIVYRLCMDTNLAAGGYGAPLAKDAGPGAAEMRSHALLAAFGAIAVATALLCFFSAAIAWRLLPARPVKNT